MRSVLLFIATGFSICMPSVIARSLQKRAAFYIANETACVVDSIVYYNGDPIPTDDPCEACKCRPPGFACVLRECEAKPGCRAVRKAGHCCPEYVCGCEHNGRMYRDGDEIRDSQNPCYTCHCQGSAIACAFVDCFFRVDCAPDYVPGECCPRYDHCSPLGPSDNETISKELTNDAQPTTTQDTLKTTLKIEVFTDRPVFGLSDGVNDGSLETIGDKQIVNKPSLDDIQPATEIPKEPLSDTETTTGANLPSPANDEAVKPESVDPVFYIPKEGETTVEDKVTLEDHIDEVQPNVPEEESTTKKNVDSSAELNLYAHDEEPEPALLEAEGNKDESLGSFLSEIHDEQVHGHDSHIEKEVKPEESSSAVPAPTTISAHLDDTTKVTSTISSNEPTITPIPVLFFNAKIPEDNGKLNENNATEISKEQNDASGEQKTVVKDNSKEDGNDVVIDSAKEDTSVSSDSNESTISEKQNDSDGSSTSQGTTTNQPIRAGKNSKDEAKEEVITSTSDSTTPSESTESVTTPQNKETDQYPTEKTILELLSITTLENTDKNQYATVTEAPLDATNKVTESIKEPTSTIILNTVSIPSSSSTFEVILDTVSIPSSSKTTEDISPKSETNGILTTEANAPSETTATDTKSTPTE